MTKRTRLRRRHKRHKQRNRDRGFRRRHGLPESGPLTVLQVAMAMQPERTRALVERFTKPIKVHELDFLSPLQKQRLQLAIDGGVSRQ